MIAPLVLLGFWGYSYLRDCLTVLSAPGVPVEMRIRTPAGMTRLVATSYNIAPARGLAVLFRPRYYDPEGKLLASAEQVTVSGIDLRRGSDQAVHVTVSNLFGRLTRLRNGRFQLQDLIPSRVGKPAQVPYDVTVNKASITLVDEAGTRPYVLQCSTDRVRVAGVTDDWAASGTVDIGGVGRIASAIHHSVANGYRIDCNTSSLQLVSLIRHAEDLPEGRPLVRAKASIGSAILRGPISVLLSPTSALSLQTASGLTLDNVRYQDAFVDHSVFEGTVATTGVIGKLNARSGRLVATFDGSARWSDRFSAGGQFHVNVPSLNDLPQIARRSIPKNLSAADAEAQGWVSISDPRHYSAQGTLTVGSGAYARQSLRAIDTQFAVNPDRVVVNLRSATWQGQPLAGAFEVARSSRQVQGGVEAPTVDLHTVGAALNHREISGQGSANALISGTLDRPHIAFEAMGRAKYASHDVRLDPSLFEAFGTYDRATIQIVRAYLTGRDGDAFLTGAVHPNRTIGFQVAGRQIQLSAFLNKVQGPANIEGDLTGTIDSPKAKGRLEAYALSIQGHEVPLVTTDFTANREAAFFTGARAIQGSAQLVASGEYLFGSEHMSARGAATGVQIADYLGENSAGMVDVPNIRVVGSLHAPLVTADVTGDSLLIQGVKIDSVTLHGSADRNGLTLDPSTAKLAGGSISATGDYDFATRTANVQANATPLSLSDLAETAVPDTPLAGTIQGSATVKLQGQTIESATGNGRLAGVAVGGTLIGDGPWNLSGSGKLVSGSLEVGYLDRFISLENLTLNYGPDRPIMSGEVDLYNLKLQDIIDIGIKYFPNLSYDSLNALESSTGAVTALAQIHGEVRDPAIDVSSLGISDIHVQGRALGSLQAKFSRSNRVWTIDQFRLTDGQSNLTAGGTVDEVGAVNVSGDLAQLPIANLDFLSPNLVGMSGTVSAAFVADGQTSDPRVRGSLSLQGLFADPAVKDEDHSLRVELGPVTITQSQVAPDGVVTGGIEASGIYFYRGFEGKIGGQLPLTYPFAIPNELPIHATLSISQRKLSEIASITGGIDAARTDGTVEGSLEVDGTVQKPALKGDAQLVASAIAADGVDNLFKNVKVVGSIRGNDAKLTVQGESSLGGTVTGALSSQLDDLSNVVDTIQQDGVNSLLQNLLTGNAKFDQLKLRQSFPEKAYVTTTVDGNLNFGGSFKNPAISGGLSLSNLESVVPTLGSQAAEFSHPIINPRFNLAVDLADTAHVTASAVDLYLDGGGTIKGSLAEPQLDALLTVDKGQMRLPTSTVRIDDGGTVNLVYHQTPTSSLSRLAVDMTGTAQVVGPGANASIQRYDVTLSIDGDLLASDGLHLSATSDPPDLNQDQILGLLGQAGALESINSGSGVSRGEAQRQIQSAMAGFALPSVANGVTNSIARSLGLDYLELGYSPYQDAMVSFAKTLGADLTFQGTTGLSQPPPGYPFQYDYRLVLRPRSLRGILTRFSVYIGSDQYSPWKIGLVYGSRF